jgi:hypothetical protein
MLTVGTGLLRIIDLNSSESTLLGLPILWSAAIGALMRLLHLPMQASVADIDDTGLVIGLLLAIRLMGGLVGLALGSTIFSSVFASSIATIAELPESLAILKDPSKAIGFIPMLRTLDVPRQVLDPVLIAYMEAMRAIFYAMTGVAGLGLVTSLFTKDLTLDRTEMGRQRFEK